MSNQLPTLANARRTLIANAALLTGAAALGSLFSPAVLASAGHGTPAAPTPPSAAGVKDGKSKTLTPDQTDWGVAGDAKKITRTINVTALDTMRFAPDVITVTAGETIKFVLKNTGKMRHEMVIGTPKALTEHAQQMVKFPKMEHEQAYMVHVNPGKTASMVWHFNRPGEFEFACLIAGHYQAGMKGRLVVASGKAQR